MSAKAAVRERSEVFAANRAVGRIMLGVKSAAGATRRARVHEEGSLRVRCPGPPAPELEAVVVNCAGGMAGGDRFALDVEVGRDARLVVTSAAAEKVYRALDNDTRVDVRLVVEDNGRLAWLPQETILFDRARLRRTIEVNLAANARLLLLESTVFGRSGMGEAVTEGRLFDRWRIRRAGTLAYAETVRLEGPIADKLARPAVASGSVAVATIVIVPGDESLVAAVRAALQDHARGEIGASAWNGLAVIRFVAPDGAALRHDLTAVLTTLRGADLPRLWLN